MAGHRLPKDSVASARLYPAIHLFRKGHFAKIDEYAGQARV
jgi:hypothetical protein